MQQQRRTGLAITAGVVVAVLWHGTTEVSNGLLNAGHVPPLFFPGGSSFPLAVLPALTPDGGLWLLGAVLSFVLVGVAVALGIRAVLRPGFDGLRSFLAIWMVVVLAALLTPLLTLPLLAHYDGGMLPSNAVFRGAYWGVLVGWVAAALVALGSRRAPG
ncbi:hypothetical protein [Pseudactinotalea sp.]|uniref:hypothetical protein n=1 Tax=Pseudactinotalea sp. TaxID=1926260 RepID=UPI003B3AFBCF